MKRMELMKKIFKSNCILPIICLCLTIAACTLVITFCRAPTAELPDPIEPETYVTELSAYFDENRDLILESYNDPELNKEVLAFFENITGSSRIAEVVLANAVIFNIAPALAFSLCAEESAYNPQAYNKNRNETIDRGLFQLNSASFPQLNVNDFYNPELNTWYGLSHLRWCLDTAGTEVSALAMYNAGTTRVRSHGTPKHTLDYVSRILKRQRKMEELFIAEYPNMIIEKSQTKTPFRFSLLAPLGGR